MQWAKGLLNGFAIGEQMKKVQVVSHNIVAVGIVLLGIAHNFPAALLMKNVCPPLWRKVKKDLRSSLSSFFVKLGQTGPDNARAKNTFCRITPFQHSFYNFLQRARARKFGDCFTILTSPYGGGGSMESDTW